MVSASPARMPSSALVVSCCVFVEYGVVFSTAAIRSWSKKVCPTYDECVIYRPEIVPLARTSVSLVGWVRTFRVS